MLDWSTVTEIAPFLKVHECDVLCGELLKRHFTHLFR